MFPKRAVITAGMPYGNKELHFGHIGGVFIHADVFARFLRDRIGEENVIFVSGTDCYGSPILESYRKLKDETGSNLTIEEYVYENHKKQKETLDQYEISLNLYGTSALGRSGEIHNEVSKEVFEELYQKGFLEKLSTPQFYDPDYKVLLNGRQVVGQCPIQGCNSERGYADECSLGHQYMPGEDNIYFYGIAEMGMFKALQEHDPKIRPEEGKLILPHLITNNHVLFMDKKASSSGAVKPPMAKELLSFYTPEQLRMHFISLGLDTKSVSFQPKAFMEGKDDSPDTVVKEGNLLTNVFNRMIRSCFYTAQKYYDSRLPEGEVSEAVREEATQTILNFERRMYNHEFHRLTDLLDAYIRGMNKYWVNNIRIADTTEDDALRRRVLIDTFHAVRTIATLLHPLAPSGCEMVREYLGVGKELWSWEYIFKPLDELIRDKEHHTLKYLESRVDFFKRHESQFEA